MMHKINGYILLWVILGTSVLFSQVYISGILDLTARNYSAQDITNKTFAGFSNFDFIRTRVFVDAKASDRAAVFTQFLVNNNRISLYGAYLKLTGLVFNNVNLNAGFIPNTVGTYGPRTYSNKNPLVGTPLLYNYHTAMSVRTFSQTPAELLQYRGKGYQMGGLPLIYDACWNTGVEIYGSAGILDWSVGALSGSVSYPRMQPEKDISQFTGKLTFYFSPEFQITVSGFSGPYLPQDDNLELPPNSGTNDYLNSGAGLGIQFSRGYMELFSETFFARWEHPYLGNLDIYSGYLEGKYKFAAQWYAAARGEFMRFSDITTSDGNGTINWDHPLNRYETGLGYKVDRAVTLKMVYQFARFLNYSPLNDDIFALQISVVY